MRFNRDNHSILIYRGLVGLVLALVLILLVGTIVGLITRSSRPSASEGPDTSGISSDPTPGVNIFTGLGQLRIPTADTQSETVILFISFVFDPDDRAFSEELTLRIRELREITANYIGSFPAAELRNMSEDLLKSELLRRFNAVLRLGRIETLFLIDFMVI